MGTTTHTTLLNMILKDSKELSGNFNKENVIIVKAFKNFLVKTPVQFKVNAVVT